MRTRRLSNYYRGAAAVSSIIGAFAAPKVRLGVNLPAYASYDRTPGYVNLMIANTGYAGVPVDANGFPTTDFAVGTYTGPASAPYTVTFQVTGQCSVAWASSSFQRGGSNLSAVTYNAGTNTSRFTYTYDPVNFGNLAPIIQFSNTKRLPGDSPGTGLTNIYAWSPAYVGNTTQVWTDELATLVDFAGTLRTMDVQIINGDVSTTDTVNLVPYDKHSVYNCIAIANQLGKDLWMQIPTAATANWDNAFFTYVDANLRSDLKLHVGYSNETWNYQFSQFSWTLLRAAEEMHAAVGTVTGRKFTACVRASNVTTLTLDYTPDVSVGEVIATTNMGSTSADRTITAVDTVAKTITYADTGADGTPFGVGNSNAWFVSRGVTSTLNPSGANTNIYGLAGAWRTRRLAQASARCRAIVGDAKMMTRFRPMLEDQMVGNDTNSELSYLASLLGGAGLVKTCIYATAGAPYYGTDGRAVGLTDLSSDNSVAHTQADYLAVWAATASYSKNFMKFLQRAAAAASYGIKTCCYEGGVDSTRYSSTSTANDTANDATKIAAKYTAPMGPIVAGYLSDLGTCGIDLFMHYSAAVAAPTDGKFTWGYTDDYNHVTPYWQAFRDYKAADPLTLPSINPLALTVSQSATVDGRLYIGAALGSTPSGSYVGLTPSIGYCLTVANAGTYTFKFSYFGNYLYPNINDKWAITLNGTLVGTETVSNTGANGDLTTQRDSGTYTLTLTAGMNFISLTSNYPQSTGNTAIRLLTLGRTA